MCAAGYQGPVCASDIDECASYPCIPNGACVDSIQDSLVLVNAYSCECYAGFDGENCDVQLCACSSSPCLNGGTCTDSCSSGGDFIADDMYICDCPPGYFLNPEWNAALGVWAPGITGHCDSYLTPCISNPCNSPYADSTCVDLGNSQYNCVCADGYEGDGNLDFQVR
jgi:protein crumbs